MTYSKETFIKAKKRLKGRADENKALSDRRQNEIYFKLPEVRNIDIQLQKTGAEVAKVIFSGSENSEELINALKTKNQSLQLEKSSILSSAGYSLDYLKPIYSCKKCEDTGYIKGYMCDCLKQEIKNISHAGLNRVSPLSLADFSSFDLNLYPEKKLTDNETMRDRMAKILDYCKAYASDLSDKSPSIYINGATGLGKTHISLAIASTGINSGLSVLYGSWQSFLNNIEREKYSFMPNDTLNSLIDCDLLILDDLGAELQSKLNIASLYEVINSRLYRQKPTIINSNLAPSELYETYNERIASRIIGCYQQLAFCGDDIRQKAKTEF